MDIAAHMQKYRRFDDARQRLDPMEDFDLWYWAISSAGAALLNAALHKLGVTRENRYFATQIPDVYAVADSKGGWRYELASGCDLIHANIPQVPDMPAQLAPAFEAMDAIERFRNPCIRGEHPLTPELLRSFEQAYTAVRRVAGVALQEELA